MTSASTAEEPKQSERWHFRRLALLISAGIGIGLWLAFTPQGLLGKADAIGYGVCHRIDLRSFHLGDRALPLCARCTGMYLSALVGLLYYAVRRPRVGLFPPRQILGMFILFGLFWAIDGVNSFMSLLLAKPLIYPPHNALRLITGSMMGICLASVIYPIFNQSVWINWRREPVLSSLGELLPLLGLEAVVVAIVLTENPLLIYPLALLSSLGVLVMLTAIYLTILITVTRRENRTNSWQEIAQPLIGSVLLAVIQIGLIDIGRFLLIGGEGL